MFCRTINGNALNIPLASKPGDIVLDPFAGTSTVGTMAIRHNRSFVGVELNPEYIKLAQKRTATLQPMLIGVG